MSLFKKYCRDLRGNTTIMFALAVVPLLLAAGAGVDMLRVNNTQTVLQGAADAAAVAGAASGYTDKQHLDKIVNDYIKANGTSQVLKSVSKLEGKLDASARTFEVTITGKMDTTLMRVAGINSMDVGAFSKVSLPNDGLEVALVLDNTGSMNDSNRLPALKNAAKQLVDEVMKGASTGGYVRVGVVPFSEYVNVGMGNRNASWIDVPADTSTTTQQCWDTYPNAVSSNCHDVTTTWYQDGIPSTSTYQQCDWNYGSPVQQCGPVTSTTTWAGCVGSRNNGLDTKIVGADKYPGVMNVNCPAPLIPLSSDQAAINTAIDSMAGVGNTYIPAGLLWGWQLLDSGVPYTEAKSASWMKSHGGTKALVLMTDGDNTLQPSYPYHSDNGGDPTTANAKVTELCDNIKGEDVVVYTVSLMVSNPTSQAMLVNCASDGKKAFKADDPAALAGAFKQITESLLALRIVK